ncbi:MAG: hypothetical protein U0946_04445 [Patescibacteria group bacterium]|nr:hypothetical protein [Patescibacteria group bacterium]
MENHKKLKIIGLTSLGVIILAGIIVSILPTRRLEPVKVEVKNELEKVEANQMGWVFFEDYNANGEFDYDEKVFKSVSVAVRRPGETTAFVIVPADENGVVKVDGLEPGNYEVQYLNYELEQPYEIGEWSLKRYYQIIEAGKSRYSLLPTDWQAIELTSIGFKAKVGLREYQPTSALVIREGQQVKFYDPDKGKILGQSQSVEEPMSKFYLKGNEVYYRQDKDLKRFNFKDKLVTTVQEPDEEIVPEKPWFYSDDTGSYFYNQQTDKTIKYTALGSRVKAVISEDKKYVGAKLNGSLIVVDYPAVLASGVEKHYILPLSGQMVFSGDEVLVNEGKEIVRVALKGDGVWEIKERMQLAGIQADELLGEIK